MCKAAEELFAPKIERLEKENIRITKELARVNTSADKRIKEAKASEAKMKEELDLFRHYFIANNIPIPTRANV